MKVEKIEGIQGEELGKIARLEREMRQTVQNETEKLNAVLASKNQKIDELRERNSQLQIELSY
jgi:hypothetical protein